MKKMLNRFLVLGLGVAGFLGSFIGKAKAAADTDLVDALASTSLIASDNKSTIMGFFVSIGLVILVIVLAKGGLNWAIAKMAGIFGRRRRR